MVDTPHVTELRGYDSYEVRLGDEMRGERATMGKSLLDVQRELRIQASYIAAIENCDYSIFPNKSFVAGYVRSYARYLKLDSDAIYERFCEESEFHGVNAGLAPARKESGGRIVPTGPVRLEKDDPLFFQHRGAAHPGGLLNTVSLAGIGSVMVLVLLIGGLGFAGWKVVQNIQRVELSPVDQTPVLITDVEIPGAPSDHATETILAATRQDALIDRLIRPQTLPRPIFEPLDGPIVNIDPEKEGLVLTSRPEAVMGAPPAPEDSEVASTEPSEPQVTERISPPVIQVLATNAAWVRLYFPDGSVLFEKIMEKDEVFELPQDIDAPLLRAGNSGSVFLVVDGIAYGPVGSGTKVAKKVSLAIADIKAEMAVADIPGMASHVPEAENTAQRSTGN